MKEFVISEVKAETAIRNDVNQVIESLKHNKDTDCYFTTWDTTIHLLRDKILSEDDQLEYKYFTLIPQHFDLTLFISS